MEQLCKLCQDAAALVQVYGPQRRFLGECARHLFGISGGTLWGSAVGSDGASTHSGDGDYSMGTLVPARGMFPCNRYDYVYIYIYRCHLIYIYVHI